MTDCYMIWQAMAGCRGLLRIAAGFCGSACVSLKAVTEKLLCAVFGYTSERGLRYIYVDYARNYSNPHKTN